MSIKTILDNLLNDRVILSEVFHSGHRVRYGNNSTYVEVYKNPDRGEVRDVIKAATYDGAKLGVDEKGDIYAWVDDVLHSSMETALDIKFVIRFDYTHRNPILFLAQGMTDKDFKKHATPELIKRLKQIFPDITSIEMVSKPFTTAHTY